MVDVEYKSTSTCRLEALWPGGVRNGVQRVGSGGVKFNKDLADEVRDSASTVTLRAE